MAKRLPWHSAQLGERFYHDNDECPTGTGIHYYWLRHGASGRPLCRTCRLINAQAARQPDPIPPAPEDAEGAA
jgi:hypothetical protein